ncbi:TERF1-interacting nuclear factor 2 isoform X2 [Alligator sinensis]|uniref:TERF1-interacting nuclear factor 2 isoform X2 n=1 Tax=Alligator sinensis TaxID=38654 RepID=A0A1U8DVD6_ALLSI|nr:TERF1-interacting nuclear factor 2 isoform X2 [Alligator sinensis]
MAGSDKGGDGAALGLRLALAAAWHVVRARQTRDYPQALGLLEAVGQAAPDAVAFRHYAKLCLGLQAAVIMKMLEEEEPDEKIYDAVDTYFPEGKPKQHPLATPRDIEIVTEAQEAFRDQVLGLLSNRQARERYLEGQLEAEYGEAFLRMLEQLFYEYLLRLESALPLPNLYEMAWSQCPLPQATQCPKELRLLTRYLVDVGHQSQGPLPQPPRANTPTSTQQQPVQLAPQPAPGSLQHPLRLAQSSKDPPRRRRLYSQMPRDQKQGGHQILSNPRHPDTVQDVVWDSADEESSFLCWKATCQHTQHHTLIPTFHDHLGSPSTGCLSCMDPVLPSQGSPQLWGTDTGFPEAPRSVSC